MANRRVPSDDTPNRQGWGPGFKRGFDLGVERFATVLRKRLLADDFVAAGWTVSDVEAFVASIANEADRLV